MKTLITILARENSKGLPNKHLLSFNGKPLIEWTIEQAKDYALFYGADYYSPDIIVATDSIEVFNLAGNLGVCARVRNPEYATDTAGKVDAIRDVLIRKENEVGSPIYDYIIDLDATNPCRTAKDIDKSFKIFTEKQPKTLYSVVKSRKSPFFNIIKPHWSNRNYYEAHNEFGYEVLIDEREIFTRQACRTTFDLNANIYIYFTDWLRDENNKSVITHNSEIYLMPDWAFCDIDNEVDFQVAEMLHKKYILKKEGNVQSKKQDCFSSGWHGPDRVCCHGCTTQARGIYFND